jgi:phosphoribosyl 1,2-cyclic phosphate phosphodiesterase
MKVHILGTSAAEGFPGLFCRCEYCRKAKELGGKNIRTRSSTLIDETLKIDFPPDSLLHVLRDGIDLGRVEDLLITHTHMDHLAAQDLGMRLPIYAHGCDHPLSVYGHDLALRKCRDAIGSSEGKFTYHLIQPFQPFQTRSAMVTPLLADHDRDETCLLFYIEKEGKRLLHAHDTGWFPEATWSWLEGKSLDLLILDATNGHFPVRRNHLNIEAVLEICQILRDKKILHVNSMVVANHFSHNIGLQHEDLEAIFNPHGIVTAYDGMAFHI